MTVNMVRVSVKASPAEAGDAFTQIRLPPACGVSTGLCVEHHQPKAGDGQHKAPRRSKGENLGI